MPVRASEPIASSKVLSVVDVEVQVVECVVRRAIDDLLEWRVDNDVAVVDQDAPAVDKDEEPHVHESVQWEQEDEDVVWQRLRVAVERMESV